MTSNATPVVNNQRKHRRVYLGTDVEVIDVLSGEKIGKIVNITVEGLMLALKEPAQPESIYQLALALPRPVNGVDVVNIGTDCLWCSQSAVGGYYWAGMQILDASDEAESLIQILIESYGVE